MFSTKITATYSFKKLLSNIDEILSEAEDNLGQAAEKVMKQKIDSGLKPPLAKFTLKMRKKGVGWGGRKVQPTNSELPLKQTGALYDSLKFDKKTKSINMLAYGKKHHDGFPNPNPKSEDVPARRFMDLEEDNTFQTTVKAVALKSMGRKLRSAFSKKGI
tara:strand:+ start:143 stop:622 length:480 start_codon:yes stop_codon:yes gene_type:complete